MVIATMANNNNNDVHGVTDTARLSNTSISFYYWKIEKRYLKIMLFLFKDVRHVLAEALKYVAAAKVVVDSSGSCSFKSNSRTTETTISRNPRTYRTSCCVNVPARIYSMSKT